MLRLYTCIVEQHDLRVLALAAAICVLSCYTAADLIERARRSAPARRGGWTRAAAAIFGAGVWTTHFLAELAYNPGLPLGYDAPLTALSLIVAVGVGWLGLRLALRHAAPLRGGALLGGAAAAMHYTGMAALRVPATIHWQAGYVAASLAAAVGLGAAALALLWRPPALDRRVLGAALLVGAICGLHFIGMAAVTLTPDPLIVAAGAIVSSGPLIAAVAAVTVFIVALALAGLGADSRMARRAEREAERLRRSESRLRRSERHLARAQQVAEIGSFESDLHGAIVWSDNLYRLFGVDKESFAVSFEAMLALVHPEDRARVARSRDALRAGHEDDGLAFRIVRRDGSCRHLVREVELNRAENGAVLGVFGTIRDVTAATVMDEQRRALEAQLLHAQKLEALGTLAGGVAHDLNNTLVPVLALAKLTMRHLPEGSRDRANLATILQAGERARDLVRQILAFSRKEAPTRQAIDVAALLRDALRMLSSSLPATIRVEEQIGDVPLISADPGQLHQIILNLVVNAAQAIGDKIGRITVMLAADPHPLPDESGGERLAATVHLAVQDSGSGMDEATQRRVFEPFFTTKPVGEGSGLGLSVVHGIVAQHGGRITVASEPGKGTRFDVYLPALSDEEEAQHLESAALAI